MKKLISIFTCILMVSFLSSTTIAKGATQANALGDLDANSKITAADARLCLRASAKLIHLSLQQRLAADIFGTGKITAANARIILRVSAKLEKFEEVDGVFIPQLKNPEVLSKEQEEDIKNDWIKTWENKHTETPEVSLKYLGTYNSYVILTIKDNYYEMPAVTWNEDIDGVIFSEVSGNGILAWKDGSFISLKSAYEQGLLNKDNLKNIKYQREIKFLKSEIEFKK